MVFLSQRAPIEGIVGIVCGLRYEDDVFILADSMLEAGGTLH
jgi:hypothetical protein